jgi:hypothetical protein
VRRKLGTPTSRTNRIQPHDARRALPWTQAVLEGLLIWRAASAQRMGAAGAADRPDASRRRPDSCS